MATKRSKKPGKSKAPEGVIVKPEIKPITSETQRKKPAGTATGAGKVKSASGGSEGTIASRPEDVSGKTKRNSGRAAAQRSENYSGSASATQIGMKKDPRLVPKPAVESPTSSGPSRAKPAAGKSRTRSVSPGKSEKRNPKK